MLGFGKNKKTTVAPDAQEEPAPKAPEPDKKKRVFRKWVFILLVSLVTAGAAASVVYILYLTPKGPGGKTRAYKPVQLSHVHLPEEMIQFSFEYFPDLFDLMVTYDTQMNLFDREIDRIDGIARKYPDQKKIADTEKKVWEKARNALEKAFLKIEKPVKETYVLFRVNREQGLVQIQTQNRELTEMARTALIPARALTRKSNLNKPVPQGMIKGTIDNLKKKFL